MTQKFTLMAVVLLLAGGQMLMSQQSGTHSPSPQQSASASAKLNASAGAEAKQALASQPQDDRYELTAGDELQLHFPFATDFDQTVTVQPDGYISLREVGDIHVAGETKPQVTADLNKAYSSILRDPSLTIELTNFNKPYFLVDGQVASPGKFDLHGPVSVMEAIAMAGGFTGKSKHSDVLLYRRVANGWVEAKQLNLKKMLSKGNLNEDLMLHPGDLVFVPQNTMSKVSPYIPLPRTGINMTGSQF